ncbi:MAG: Methylglyoxal synthase [ANME-2 cluster archaeon]|nr:Methylglyoxal synthase [ANME-2 cluster archaeon]
MFHGQDLNIKCDKIYIGELAVKIHIALVVQEGMKDNLQKLVNDHKAFLSENYIVSTKGTAEYLHEKTELVVTKIVNSGQEGGDIIIANMLLEGDIDVAIFLLNPIRYFPHCQDAYALMRVCNFKNIPLAMNMRTADVMLSSISRES